MEPERLFSFRWHDYDAKLGVPVEKQPTTLVEFRFEPTGRGTRLTITESGIAALPDPRRVQVLRDNNEGWDIQARNVADYVAAHR
jgi:hypothetical protein